MSQGGGVFCVQRLGAETFVLPPLKDAYKPQVHKTITIVNESIKESFHTWGTMMMWRWRTEIARWGGQTDYLWEDLHQRPWRCCNSCRIVSCGMFLGSLEARADLFWECHVLTTPMPFNSRFWVRLEVVECVCGSGPHTGVLKWTWLATSPRMIPDVLCLHAANIYIRTVKGQTVTGNEASANSDSSIPTALLMSPLEWLLSHCKRLWGDMFDLMDCVHIISGVCECVCLGCGGVWWNKSQQHKTQPKRPLKTKCQSSGKNQSKLPQPHRNISKRLESLAI